MKNVRKSIARYLLLATVTILCSSMMYAQGIAGQWNGALDVKGAKLRLVLHVKQAGAGYMATMDSPDQGAKGIPVTSVHFENNVLTFKIANAGIEYSGVLNQDSIREGVFKQSGTSFPMDLYRVKETAKQTSNNQEPLKPYPYYCEEVKFENKVAGISLAGTLTLPGKEGHFPAVVLISGSGPQNRDEELLGHRPFLVWADYLTRHGIAVLRYDDRGTAGSGGIFKNATSADFATDVKAAVAYLQNRKEINKNKIGLMGHSEGGSIAPMVAAGNNDIDFIVLLAGPGIAGDELLLLQQQLIGKADGATDSQLEQTRLANEAAFHIIRQSKDDVILKTELEAMVKKDLAVLPDSSLPAGVTREALVIQKLNAITNPWMLYFLRYDPADNLRKVTCPVLAINGSKDLQVPATINLAALKKHLNEGGNRKVTVKELPGLNHLFQECATGAPSEYGEIEQTVSPTALKEVSDWIVQQVK